MAEPAGELDPSREGSSPWPANARFVEGGLTIAGVPAVDLADRFGTPLLVIDELDVRTRMRTMRAAFPRVAYAVKAFTCHALIRIALQEGLELLCASGGELEACVRAGAPAGRVLLHGNAKTDAELRAAVSAGVGLVIADGIDELERLAEIARGAGVVQPVLLRVVPEVEVHTHEAIATGHAESKFGTALAEAPKAARRAASLEGIRLDGFHAHAGSQVLEVAPYVRVLERLLDVASDADVRVRVLDIGGGFGVGYTDERPLAVDELAAVLSDRLAELSDRPELLIEPGRALIANPGLTLYQVLARKRVGTRTLVAVDGGMSENPRPMLYGARYRVAPAGAHRGPAGATERVTLVGRHCESGDVLVPTVELPAHTAPSDLLAMAATGAYTYPLASSYNRFGRPAVVGVHDGRAEMWLRREDAADLDRLEAAAVVSTPDVRLPDDVRIRRARPSDARSFVVLLRATLAEEGRARDDRLGVSTRACRRRFRRPWSAGGAEIVAIARDRVVGHVALARDPHPASQHVASLGIAVDADRRGEGIGTALLAEAFRWARDVRVEKLGLTVSAGNIAATTLYRRFGFLEEGRLARQFRAPTGDRDDILMAAWVGGRPEGT
jgi:diaminopimelate decarboxylase